MNIIKFYKVTDVTNEYKNYSEVDKQKYRSVLADDMIIGDNQDQSGEMPGEQPEGIQEGGDDNG